MGLRSRLEKLVYPIIQILSDAVHYGVTKAVEFALARGTAETIRESGVTVNSLREPSH